MSLKRVVLIAAMLTLVSPAIALADGITFGFTGGPVSNNLNVPRPFVLGSTGTMIGTVQMMYVTAMGGNVPFGPPVAPTYGNPPIVLPPFTWTLPLANYGTMSFVTGSAIGVASTTVTFGAGGTVNIFSDTSGNLQTATGGAIPNGTNLFTGYFSGPTTMTQINAPSAACLANVTCAANFNYHYSLIGPVEGNLATAVLNHFNLGTNAGSSGILLNMVFGFVGPNDPIGTIESAAASVVTVPEPGTLALFGTGLIGVAGFIRRRLKG